jgi:phycoerythrin-associated linker protein
MDITEFVASSIGRWRSQRSVHHLAFGHFEAVQSDIEITALPINDPAVLALCDLNQVNSHSAVSPFRMSWEGHSDWDDSEAVKGTCVLVPVPDSVQSNRGKLLRDQGYAEEIAAVGDYLLTEDGTFILTTAYDRAAAEEKIWFVNPNVRCRVSLIKTSAGTGVVTASFSSEIRQTG